MENKCEHPIQYRETYREGLFKCYSCNKVITNTFPLSDTDLKLIDEIDKKYKTGPYAPFLKRYKEDIVSWLVTLGIILAIPAFIWVVMKYFAITMLILLGVITLAIVYLIKLVVQYTIFGDK